MSATLALPGFTDPVGEAQATFRAVLDAMARPGSLHRVGEQLRAPAPLDQATAAVLLTLVDQETPLWLHPAATAAREWLAFHCGASIVDAPAKAALGLALSLPDFTAFSMGSHEAPESSATLIVQIAALESGTRYRLSGPGLRMPAVLTATGLPQGFAALWQNNHTLYPRGVDLILCAGTTLAALPRSVTIEEA
jgi:alpha-D-ribose 1-methylphosphonate 5-triphosphate synthase subunit PhnH